MTATSQFLLTLGGILLLGLVTSELGRRTFLPRVTLLLIFGTNLGSRCSQADPGVRNWMGIALLPQAGVAIGMALVAANHFPEYRQTLLTIVISSTVFFEIIGPIFTRLALQKNKSAGTR